MWNPTVLSVLVMLVPLICNGNPLFSHLWKTIEDDENKSNSYLSMHAPEECPDEKWQHEMLRMVKNADAPLSLLQHTDEFKEPNIIQVTDKVHVLIGYYLSNTIVIEAPDGLIVVDTGDCVTVAKQVLKDIRERISNKPIKGIILTHNHPDHTGGIKVYPASQPNISIDIWAHKTLVESFWNKWEYNSPLLKSRSLKQFGSGLPGEAIVNAGIGIMLKYDKESGALWVLPNKFLNSERMEINIAGLGVILLHIPGETNDQMGVYIPSMKMFLIGDNYYKAFPNLYTIRGTPSRNTMQWVKSIDKVLEFDIEYLVPSHTKPITGKQRVVDTLTKYRDAIQYVFDQTIRNMNKGMHPQEIASVVKLPESLQNEISLAEHYGTVEWGVKAIFDSKIGWFSGYPEDLFPLGPSQLAKNWIKLVDPHKLLHHARLALQSRRLDDTKWALHLSSLVWNSRRSPSITSDTVDQAIRLRTESIVRMAELQTSPNARNYYLSWVLNKNCKSNIPVGFQTDVGTIMVLSGEKLLRKLATLVNPEKSKNIHEVCAIHFTDLTITWTVTLRNSVLIINKGESEEYDIYVSISEEHFKSFLIGKKSLFDPRTGVSAYPSFEVAERFFNYFDSATNDYY